MNLTRFLTATATGLLAAVSLAPLPASAGFEGIDIGTVDVPRERPCDSKLFTPSFCLPDYRVDVSAKWSHPTTRDGRDASFFHLTVRNDSPVNGGRLFTTVGVDESDIIEIETVWGDRDVDAFPIPEIGSESTWVIEHRDGLDQHEFTVFRVWVAGHQGFDFGATTNHHVGVEYFGYARPLGYPQRDADPSNNTDSDWVNFD